MSNYEKTRWFYVLRVKKPENDALNCLLKLSNRSLALFSQPPLYEASPHILKADAGASTPMQWQRSGFEDYSHCFHISLAWSLTEPSPDERDEIANIELRELSDLRIYFDRVKAKIGNNITSMPLVSLLG